MPECPPPNLWCAAAMHRRWVNQAFPSGELPGQQQTPAIFQPSLHVHSQAAPPIRQPWDLARGSEGFPYKVTGQKALITPARQHLYMGNVKVPLCATPAPGGSRDSASSVGWNPAVVPIAKPSGLDHTDTRGSNRNQKHLRFHGTKSAPSRPKMATFDGSGKDDWDSFFTAYGRRAQRHHWITEQRLDLLHESLYKAWLPSLWYPSQWIFPRTTRPGFQVCGTLPSGYSRGLQGLASKFVVPFPVDIPEDYKAFCQQLKGRFG